MPCSHLRTLAASDCSEFAVLAAKANMQHTQAPYNPAGAVH